MAITQGLNPGSVLRAGTYRIDSVLGQGGFGITYLATDLTLERRVAIKEFFPKDFCDRDGSTSHVTLCTQSSYDFVDRLKAKFLKEARNIAKFDHPGIIKIHAAFEENNTAYYVMDFIDGYSLGDLISQVGVMPERSAIDYIIKVGKALEYVHARRINHLDIKPANIMVRRIDREPILIDFGLSKQYDQEGNQTSTTPTGISHGYAPMEQYTDGGVHEFSPQTDIYSLAATLYYLISGIVPPVASRLIDEPLRFTDAFSDSLKQAISKAMSPGRKMRQSSVEEFLCDIEAAKDSPTEPIVTPPSTAPETVIVNPVREDPAATKVVTPEVQEEEAQEEQPKKKKHIILWALAAVFVGLILLVVFAPDTETKSESEAATSAAPATETINQWNSPLGPCDYVGEVNAGHLPDGHGVATFTGGELKGNVYDGEFVNGVFEGQTDYKLTDGSSFKGTFRDNKYESGTYTMADGTYYVGTFKNGDVDKGTWYDKNGTPMPD